VTDPAKSVIKVEQFIAATNLLAQTTLRSVLGQHDLDEMLSARAALNADVQTILDARTKEWGIEVSAVEIRDVQLTDNMVKAIAKQAEAERDRRAKVIHAEAEFQASQVLVNAANILATTPAAMQLRYLQTLSEVGGEHNSTIIFPMPLDIIKPFLEILDRKAEPAAVPIKANGLAVPPMVG
jgi:regulator of protease activity HflC (stomatin/prohibitin superfamily)